MSLNWINLIIGAIVAILFYFIANWLLGIINFAIPNVIVALIAILIFLGFALGKININ